MNTSEIKEINKDCEVLQQVQPDSTKTNFLKRYLRMNKVIIIF